MKTLVVSIPEKHVKTATTLSLILALTALAVGLSILCGWNIVAGVPKSLQVTASLTAFMIFVMLNEMLLQRLGSLEYLSRNSARNRRCNTLYLIDATTIDSA